MAKPRNRRRRQALELSWEHPSKDRSDRFAVDQLIRDAGWRIFRRRGYKPPLWQKGHEILAQHQVLALLDRSLLADAEYLESLYWEGVPSFLDLSGGILP